MPRPLGELRRQPPPQSQSSRTAEGDRRGFVAKARETYNWMGNRLGLSCYRRPTHQTSLSAHPHHVDVSQGLFTDLTMVGVLYKLDALFLQRALVYQNTESFWVPFAIYIALYDAWEVRPIYDSQFRTSGKNLWSHVVYLALWMLIALMGTTLATEGSGFTLEEALECHEDNTTVDYHSGYLKSSPDGEEILGRWGTNEALLFCAFKAAHSLIRVVCYLEACLVGKTPQCRAAAFPRLVVYACGSIPLIAAPIMVSTNVDLSVVVLMFPLSFVVQKTVWTAVGFIYHPVRTPPPPTSSKHSKEARFNFPFYLHRLREWTELQLGACILGLIAFQLGGSVRAPQRLQIGVMVAGYVCIAALDFLSYSSHPFDFREHALFAGGLIESVWIDGFVFAGLGLLGLAVGLRYALLSPAFDYCTGTQNEHLLWLLAVASLVTILALLFQKLMHVAHESSVWSTAKSRKRFWIVSFLLAVSSLITPIVMMFNAEAEENIAIGFYTLLNVALAVLAIILIDAGTGGFRHKIRKETRIRLSSYALAAVVAMQWLTRARRNLDQRTALLSSIRSLESNLSMKQEKKSSTTARMLMDQIQLSERIHRLNNNQQQDVPEQTVQQEQDDPEDDDDQQDDDAQERPTKGTFSAFSEGRSVHVFIKTLNDLFYESPKLLAEDDLFAEYKLSWSDLFLDIIYVSAVFRLGDYLIGALGLGVDPKEQTHQPGAAYLFGSLFLSVFSCWWSKISYTAKCAVPDIFHKIVDVAQGFLIYAMASAISSPQEMGANDEPAYIFSIALLLFHLIMLFLWVELGRSSPQGSLEKKHRQREVAIRNVNRTLLAVSGVLMAILCIAMDAPWSLTSFFLSGTWLFPWLYQLVVASFFREERIMEIADEHEVELLGYVQHRIGDLSLLWLGEGVMQVVRSQNVSYANEYSYAVFAFAFLNLSLCRSLLFKLGLFGHDHQEKLLTAVAVKRRHQPESRDDDRLLLWDALALILTYLLRSMSGPCIVAMGIGLKKIVALTNEMNHHGYTCNTFMKKHVYEVYTGSAVLVHFIICVIYHIHRSGYSGWKSFAWKQFLGGAVVISLLFLVLTWVDCVLPLGVLIYTNCLWILSLAFHAWTDDFLRASHSTTSGGAGSLFGSSLQLVNKALGERDSIRTLELGWSARSLLMKQYSTITQSMVHPPPSQSVDGGDDEVLAEMGRSFRGEMDVPPLAAGVEGDEDGGQVHEDVPENDKSVSKTHHEEDMMMV